MFERFTVVRSARWRFAFRCRPATPPMWAATLARNSLIGTDTNFHRETCAERDSNPKGHYGAGALSRT
jgi:hypothetical protein